MLVNRAALDRRVGPQRSQRPFQARRAVGDDQLRRPQPPLAEIVEQRAPGGLAFSAHAPDRQHHLLAVGPHAERRQERDRRRALVEADADNGTVKDQPHDRLLDERPRVPGVPVTFHLAPGAADHVLAHRPGEHRSQCPPNPAGIGPGKIGPGDQRVGRLGAPLVGAKRGAPPFARPAVRAHQSGARHGNLRSSERPGQTALAMAVPDADDRRRFAIRIGFASSVARTRQRTGEFLLQHHLDEAPNASANPVLDRVEPIVEKQWLGGDTRLLHGILPHGVVSVPTSQRRNHLGWATRRLRQPNFHHLRDGTCCRRWNR